jgi:hypothetical protein
VQRRAKTHVVWQQGYKNFGLQSPYVQALIELLPRPPQCGQEPLPYVSLEARTPAATAAAPAAVAGMALCSTPLDARGTPLNSDVDSDSDDSARFGQTDEADALKKRGFCVLPVEHAVDPRYVVKRSGALLADECKLIGPAGGRLQLQLPDGEEATLTIEPGAVLHDIWFRFTAQDAEQDVDGEAEAVSALYTVMPHGLQLLLPAQLVIPLRRVMSDLDLAVLIRSSAAEAPWALCCNTRVAPNGRTCTALLWHFSWLLGARRDPASVPLVDCAFHILTPKAAVVQDAGRATQLCDVVMMFTTANTATVQADFPEHTVRHETCQPRARSGTLVLTEDDVQGAVLSTRGPSPGFHLPSCTEDSTLWRRTTSLRIDWQQVLNRRDTRLLIATCDGTNIGDNKGVPCSDCGRAHYVLTRCLCPASRAATRFRRHRHTAQPSCAAGGAADTTRAAAV